MMNSWERLTRRNNQRHLVSFVCLWIPLRPREAVFFFFSHIGTLTCLPVFLWTNRRFLLEAKMKKKNKNQTLNKLLQCFKNISKYTENDCIVRYLNSWLKTSGRFTIPYILFFFFTDLLYFSIIFFFVVVEIMLVKWRIVYRSHVSKCCLKSKPIISPLGGTFKQLK